MRKFSKILAVLLAVCAIFGIVAMSVSGADAAISQLDASQYGSGITNIFHMDGGLVGNSSSGYYAPTNGDYQNGYKKAESAKYLDNDYVRLYSPNLPVGSFAINSMSVFVNPSKIAYNANAYSIYDIDFGSDAYLKADGTLDYEATSGKLAYLQGSQIGLLNGSGWEDTISFVCDENGKWYLSEDATYEADKDMPLSTEKGVFNHLTFVALEDGNLYVFVNGAFFYNVKLTASKNIQRICFNDNNASATNYYSLCIDNGAGNHYAKGYTSGDKYGIDDYIAEADFTKPLYKCEDVVYNTNYTYTSPVDGQCPVMVDTVAGEPVRYLFTEKAIEAINAMKAEDLNLAKVTINQSIEWTPVENLKSITFIAKDGAVVTIPQEAKDNGYSVSASPNADGTVNYTVKMAESANVVFVDDAGNVLATKQSPIGAPLKTLDVQVPVTYLNNGKYKVLDHWELKNGNNEIITLKDDTKIESDFVFYASDRYTPGVNSIVVKAHYNVEYDKDFKPAFVVISKKTNAFVITKDIGQDAYLDIKNVAKCVNAAEEEVNLVLYKDAEIASVDSLVVKANATLNVDLNGNALTQNGGIMFTVNDGATLNITSGAVGAEVNAVTFIAGDDEAKSYNINIVNEKDAEIDVYAAALVDIKGGAFAGEEGEEVNYNDLTKSSASDEKPVVINIIGGKYTADATISGAMFNVATTEVQINIADADFFNNVNAAIFASAADSFAEADITVSGTYLSANGHSSAFVLGAFGKNMAIEIGNDTKIIGDIFAEKALGSVTIGAYTYIQLGTNAIKYTEVALADDLTLADNCIPVRANLYDKDFDVYYGIAVLDETDAEAMANVVTITWLDPNGEVFAVEEWFKGSTAVAYDTNDFGVLTDTKNGWYTLGYASWEDENATDLKYNPDYKFDRDITFSPVKGRVASVAVKVNMSLLTKFEANLYIPLATPNDVQFLGLFTQYDASFGVNDAYMIGLDTMEETSIDGMEYYKHSFFFDNSDVDKSVTRYLVIKVHDDVMDRDEIMVQKITVDLLGYAEAVMEQYGCGSEEAVLAYNLINYANEAYEFKNEVEYAPAAEFLALLDHDIETCTCAFGYEYDLEEVSLNYKEGLGDGVYGISYDLSNEMPAFILYANTDKNGNSLIKKVTVKFHGINGSVDDAMYEYNLTLVRGKDVVIDNATYATFSFKSMPLYNAAEVMTITVTNADDTVCTGTYSLATYIDHFICYPAENSGLDVAQALYSFAKVAKEYKDLAD